MHHLTPVFRIAAVSVAERMAQERAEEVGSTIGYHIKLEKKASYRTRCLLMTTGVLLRKIQLEGFVGVSHLFIDEGQYLSIILSISPVYIHAACLCSVSCCAVCAHVLMIIHTIVD